MMMLLSLPQSVSALVVLLLCTVACLVSAEPICYMCGNPNNIPRNPSGTVAIPPNPFLDLSRGAGDSIVRLFFAACFCVCNLLLKCSNCYTQSI